MQPGNREVAEAGSLRLRVVIVNYRSAGHVRALLDTGLLDAHDVIVVDNASEPADVSALGSFGCVTPILVARNIGFAAAINSAIAEAPASTLPLVLLNPDVKLTPHVLAELHQALEGSQLDAVSPLLRDETGKVPVGVGGSRPSLWSVLAYAAFLTHLLPWTHGLFLTRRQATRGGTPDWLCMACLMLRHDVFDRFGPIPEDEIVYAEDIAWGSRASRNGARFALVADTVVVHSRGASGSSEAWIGSTERMLRRTLPGWRGSVAAHIFRTGLTVRRALRRRLS
jgi:N-acetylglucosaminyl-diphospho-decaprenol L-rhamnosyltransferase